MEGTHSLVAAQDALRRTTGVVVPVHLPAGEGAALGAALLRDTVAALCRELERPASVVLSVDGEEHGGKTAAELAAELGVAVVGAPESQGKLAAARRGVARLLEDGSPVYVAVVDSDGDHFANELANLVRAARHVEARDPVGALILGRRLSRHRPLGFLRGEYEELADRVLLDALAYDAARRGSPLRLEYATPFEECPDFHSGYKLFTREIARRVFLDPPRLCGVSDAGYHRHAVEAVMVVEALAAGAALGVVNRSTFNEQPVSAFGQLERRRLVADKIIWPCKRLAVPGAFVRQWMTNHSARLLLPTLLPQGREELRQIRSLVHEAFDLDPVPEGDAPGPLFV
jgi:hypothetical protein